MADLEIRRGETREVEVAVEGADLTGWDAYLTFANDAQTVEFGPHGLEAAYDEARGATVFCVAFTQEQTLGWPEGAVVEVQVNAVNGPARIETAIGTLAVLRTLKDGVL